MSDTPELKPCPFCGSNAELGRHEAFSTDSSFDFVGCSSCGAMIEYESRRWDFHKREWDESGTALAVSAWNTRALEDTP